MRLGIMQPYFFPYIGYFQLLRTVDLFTFHDDVQYIKGGWVNRNRIQQDGRVRWMTVPLLGGSSSRRINEVEVSSDPSWRGKLLRSIEGAYARAPCRNEVVDLVEQVLNVKSNSIAELARVSVEAVAAYLEINTRTTFSSSLQKNEELRGQDRVLDICSREGATCYINLPGGRALYDPVAFENRGVHLRFVEPRPIRYAQGAGAFVPNLSVLDILMYCSQAEVRSFLDAYDLQ